MAIEIISATHNGLDGILIKVEVDINKGMPSFNIIDYNSRVALDLAITKFVKVDK